MRPVLAAVAGTIALSACGGPPALGPAHTVTARDAANPTVAVDGATGAVYVAWAQLAPDSSWDVYLVRQAPDSAVGPAVRVNDVPGEVQVWKETPAQVVVAPDGTVYVAWIGKRGKPGVPPTDISVRLARSQDHGRTFTPTTTLDVDPGIRDRYNTYHDVAVAPDGSLYVSWLDLRVFWDSLTAHEAARLPDSVPIPENKVDFRVARSTDGGRTFEGQAVLDTISCICCRTAIAAGPDGAVHALWRHVFDGSIRDFQVARSDDRAESFHPPARVHHDGWLMNGCPDIGGDIAVDSARRVHAAWYTGASGRVGLWYARSTDRGTTFGPPVRVVPEGHSPPAQVKLAAAGEGVLAVWEDRRAAQPVLRYGRPGSRSVELGLGEFPTIAVAGTTVGVAWMSADGVRFRTGRL